MWRKETRWHSFSREHSGVKLFSQRASCRQLRVRSRATCSRVWNLWLLGSSGDHRMGGRAGGHRCLPDGDQSWNGDCRGYRAGRAQRQRLQAEFWGRSARLRFRSGHSWADRQVSKTGLGVLPVLWPSPPLCSVLGRQTRSTALQSVSVPCPVEGAQKILQACFQRHRLDLLPSSADLNVRFLGVSHCPCSAFWTPSGCGSPRAGKLYQRVFVRKKQPREKNMKILEIVWILKGDIEAWSSGPVWGRRFRAPRNTGSSSPHSQSLPSQDKSLSGPWSSGCHSPFSPSWMPPLQ